MSPLLAYDVFALAATTSPLQCCLFAAAMLPLRRNDAAAASVMLPLFRRR